MKNNRDKTEKLLDRLEALLKRQDDFSKEIESLRVEINTLKTPETIEPVAKEDIEEEGTAVVTGIEISKDKTGADYNRGQQQKEKDPFVHPASGAKPFSKTGFKHEEFIGKNLINKVGIAITVIGVAIGVKYSINHDLVSPLIRIIMGYLTGLALLGVGVKLKEKYEGYSAVLVSGAIAIMYFITYAAYNFYELIPQSVAFLLMLLFTAFTVVAAMRYNRQVIAHIGLVGAYAVPFLLGDDSGKTVVLFSYMAIINIGILVIAFRKYWKPLYYSSFGLTTLIYFLWYVTKYQTSEHFGLAFTFLGIFFTIFYLMFLVFKLLQKEKFEIADVILLLGNSFVFYSIGYSILSGHQTGSDFLGLFTICNAVVHSIVCVVIYRQGLADKNLFYLVFGLALVFITIAIPVQLNGNWVTLFWAGEAVLLFWIGRTKGTSFYEKLSYPLMALAFISLSHDWLTVYNNYYPGNPETRIIPLLNVNFLTSLLIVVALGFINILNNNKEYTPALSPKNRLSKIISFAIPAVLLVTVYYTFRIEISNYWSQLYVDSGWITNDEGLHILSKYRDVDLTYFKSVWIINYSLLFFSLLSFFNFKKLRSEQLGLLNLLLSAFTIAIFLIVGLYDLSELRENYLEQTMAEFYHRGVFSIAIRYVSFAFVALTLVTCYRYIRHDFMKRDLKMSFDFLLYFSTLWIVSSELINWMDIAGAEQSYKLGLSILWGLYSLFLIVVGIWKKKKYLRLGAIVLFGVTLVKLFLYDISHLNTIAKTIVFVSLGVLLLIISFLYNKYEHIISDGTGK